MEKSKKRTAARIKKDTERGSLDVELPAVPCFPWIPATTAPPKCIVLLVLCEEGIVLGEHDGNDYFDAMGTKLRRVYGEVIEWCIVLNRNGEAIVTE